MINFLINRWTTIVQSIYSLTAINDCWGIQRLNNRNLEFFQLLIGFPTVFGRFFDGFSTVVLRLYNGWTFYYSGYTVFIVEYVSCLLIDFYFCIVFTSLIFILIVQKTNIEVCRTFSKILVKVLVISID